MDSVALYAEDIVNCANRTIRGRTLDVDDYFTDAPSINNGTAVWGATGLATLPSILYFLNPIYHLSGFITSISAEIVDKYRMHRASKVSHELFDKKFSEYGLKNHFELMESYHPAEKSSRLSAENLVDGFIVGLSTLLPPIGYGHLITACLLYKSDSTFIKRIKKSKELGGEVKKKIEAGVPEQEIKEWLGSLQPKRSAIKSLYSSVKSLFV